MTQPPPLKAVLGAAIVAAAAVAMTLAPAGWAVADWRALVLALAAIAFWASALLPEDVTGLAFFAAAMILAVAPAETVFAGFASAAVWLVFGGLILGAAVGDTGLDRVIAARFRPFFKGSYSRCVALTVALAVALAFLVPSTMTRVVLLVPVVTALAEELGYARDGPGYVGLALAAIFASYYPAVTILPATVPTVALVGAAEAVQGEQLTYAAFLASYGPVLGVLKAVLIVLVVVRLFPAGRPTPPAAQVVAADRRRPRVAALMVVGLALWATDALHGISPAWIALALGVLCLLPGVGVLAPADLQRKVNLRPVFYVAAILGVGAVVASTGAGADAVRALSAADWLAPGREVANTLVLATGALATGAIATMPGIAAVLVPLAGDAAAATGMSLDAVFRAYVLGYATAFLPYQVPPMLVGLSLAGVSVGAATRATLALALVSIVVTWPLALLWWHLIG
ncbi:MAG: SLC13 family permease [Alphaproteobacteria bacterium]